MPTKLRRRAYERLTLPRAEQDTMVACNYCNGTGKIIIEDDGRLYRSRICPFCGSSGAVTREIYQACARWIRIIKHYQRKGLCPASFRPKF